MSLVIIKVLFALGIVGHALNMWCDRTLSITPNGRFTIADAKDADYGAKLAQLFDGVSPSVPLRATMLGAPALVLELFGYLAFAFYLYPHSHLAGWAVFVSSVLFAVVGCAHHVKTGLAGWVLTKGSCDERSVALMCDLVGAALAMRLCYVGYVALVVTLIATVISGVTLLPAWMAAFTVLPVFVVLIPARIIGTLHIAAGVSMLAWLIMV